MDEGNIAGDLAAELAENTVRAVHRCGEDLLGRSVRDAPVAEGTLRGSASLALIVSGRRFEGAGQLGAAIAYARELAKAGGRITVDAEVSFNTVYAARQHEELTWQHPKGGKARYLADNLNANAGRYAGIIEAAAK